MNEGLRQLLEARYNNLITELNKAEGIKSSKEKELEKLKSEYSQIAEDCKEKFDCEPTKLASKIKQLEKIIQSKVEEAEKLLKSIKEN